MQLTVDHIVIISEGIVLQQAPKEQVLQIFCTDSRKVRLAAQSIFVALPTKARDGHRFIQPAYEKGIRCFLVSRNDCSIEDYPEATFILVKDTLRSMQRLVASYRSRFQIPVFGITGSNGKTIVKEWLSTLLANDKEVVSNPKSYNSQIGVVHSVSRLQEKHEIALFEAGISEPNEMIHLQKMIQPTHGIFTMIGEAHDAYFENTQQKIQEKLVLFHNCEKIYYCRDHEAIHAEIQNHLLPINSTILSKTWGRNPDADLKILERTKLNLATTLRLQYSDKEFNIQLPYSDVAYIENALHCTLVLLDLGYNISAVQSSLKKLSPVRMRLELLKGINDCTLINDSYSSDVAALRIALDFLYEQKQHKKFSLILSDMMHHGSQSNVYHAVQELLSRRELQRLVLIGKEIGEQQDLFSTVAQNVQHYATVSDFLNQFDSLHFVNEAVLIKGARKYMLERIVNRLEENIHRTVMTINLSALIENVNVFKKRLKPNTKIMAMVKAFSYGSGSYEIAQTLEYHGVDYLAVAYVDEGILLRKKGIELPILILNPELSSFDAMVHHRLEPEIYSVEMLYQFADRLTGEGDKLKIHLKLDTGMHRLGVEEGQLSNLLSALQKQKCFHVVSVFSHLVASDDMSQNEFTEAQRQKFEKMSNQIEVSLGYTVIKHLANSAGAIRNPNLEFDMVRLGIGLYGVSSDESINKELQQISTLKTRVSQIKSVLKEDTVGYGRAGVLQRDSVIATLNIGYADGYPRQFSQGKGKVLINGKLAPIVGNVCMDMIMVDITDISNVVEGQEAILFDKNLPVTQLAEWIDTIPYEIVAGISQRVKRVFYRE